MGVGLSDNPAFAGMHEAGATVAAGSLRAMEAILRGDVEHAHQPGGGLHHAMPAEAWGFCIYNDPALAVVRARATGLRVLYVDLDVHHGDGVQVIAYDDPGVLTVSFHESGRYLFPETGFVDEVGEGAAAGSSVNLPLEPYTGESAWLAAVRALVPTLAAVFGPDVVVSQHGADSHAWDPLAHLRVTTTAHGEAARLVDAVAHRWAAGRWLATGGGGYDAYRVVPRTWALTWLAGAHREPDEATPAAWRDRWEAEAGGVRDAGDAADVPRRAECGAPGRARSRSGRRGVAATPWRASARSRCRRSCARPRTAGWWRPSLSWAGRPILDGTLAGAADRAAGRGLFGAGRRRWSRLSRRGARVAHARATDDPAVRPGDAIALLRAAAADGARVVGAVDGDVLVGVAVAAPAAGRRRRRCSSWASRPRIGAAASAALLGRSSPIGRPARDRGDRQRRGAGRRRAARRGAPHRHRRTRCCAAPASSSRPSPPTSAATTRGPSRRRCAGLTIIARRRCPTPARGFRDLSVRYALLAVVRRPGSHRRHRCASTRSPVPGLATPSRRDAMASAVCAG